ncbi:MAG: glycosyltransferase [Sulfuritalea sp.]|nr:glycosyltransferase [Sulfuritalea sp.]MDP1985187.1 glycosyltransferase [Sulfuritalea sp.]
MISNGRVVVITEGVPHPSKGASAVLFFHYVRALVDAGLDVLAIVIATHDVDAVSLAEYRDPLASAGRFQLVCFKGERTLVPERFGLIKRFDQFPSLSRTVEDFSPQAVLAFDVAMAAVVAPMKIPLKLAWLGDLQFESNWYNYRYSMREDWKAYRWIPYAWFQCLQWKKVYRNALKSFHRIVVSSDSSVAALQRLGLHSSFLPYPWPNQGAVDRDVQRRLSGKPAFLFFGNLVGLGSRSSLHFLFDKVYPRLIAMWGANGFTIIVGGAASPRDWMVSEIAARPEFVFEGFIDDLLHRMAECHAVITPLDVPVGNRSRIITAWAKRVLVVSHVNAARGNPALIDGQTALLATDAQEFADRMRFAYEQPAACEEIINRAERAYLEHYAPDRAAPAFADMIAQASAAQQTNPLSSHQQA